MREIFYSELSPIATERLPEAPDAPLQAFPMVLLPMGSGLTEEVKNCHTHIKIIIPLQVRSGLSVETKKDYTMTDLYVWQRGPPLFSSTLVLFFHDTLRLTTPRDEKKKKI